MATDDESTPESITRLDRELAETNSRNAFIEDLLAEYDAQILAVASDFKREGFVPTNVSLDGFQIGERPRVTLTYQRGDETRKWVIE